MTARFMRPINAVVERWIPSALAFAVLLSGLVAAMALTMTDIGAVDLLFSWGNGLSGLLPFMTQMALILLLSFAVAHTRPVRAALHRLGGVPRTAIQAYLFVFVAAALAALLNWALGLVVGGLLARDVAIQARRRGVVMSFPMLVACGYSGFVVWHMGLSGSGPLVAATEGSFVATQIGTVIPLSQTTFAGWNLVTAPVTIAVVALALWLVAPQVVEPSHAAPESLSVDDDPIIIEQVVTPADRLDASRWLTGIVGVLLMGYLVAHFSRGGGINLDIVNWTLLALLFLLVRHAFELMALVRHAAGNVGEILLQFPLYAGVMGMMAASGLVKILSDWFVAISTPETLGLLGFLSAGLVNFFVPSGGGQVAVQAPILLDAARQLGVDPAVMIMAIAYGDQWTNMVQPIWAVPLLAIAGLHLRDILGYKLIALLASGLVFATTLWLVGAGT